MMILSRYYYKSSNLLLTPSSRVANLVEFFHFFPKKCSQFFLCKLNLSWIINHFKSQKLPLKLLKINEFEKNEFEFEKLFDFLSINLAIFKCQLSIPRFVKKSHFIVILHFERSSVCIKIVN